MRLGAPLGLAVVTVITALSPAYAQTDAPRRPTFTFGTGAASSSTSTGATFAAAVSFDLSRRASIDTEARYMDRGPGADAFNASANVLFNVGRTHGRVAPFAMAGAGLHRATFNLNHPRFLGNAGQQFQPGALLCTAHGSGFQHHAQGWHQGTWPHEPGTGPHHLTPIVGMPCADGAAGHWGAAHMPEFYARRMGTMRVPETGVWQRRTFIDPMLTVGGGIKLRTIRHMTLRLDARALLLFDSGATHTIGVFGFNVGYKF